MEIEKDGDNENTDTELEHNEKDIYMVQLNDLQAQHTDNTGYHYIDVDDDVNISVVSIDKENLDEY
jgi:hypothetical protein